MPPWRTATWTRSLRGETVTEVVGHLEAGAHVNLIGMPGSGRSSLLRETKQELDTQGWRVFELAGVTAFRDRPLVPLALAGVNPMSGPLTTAAIASSTDALSDVIGRPSTVLIVDDADDLDKVSAGVVIAAERRAATPILTTTRPGRRSSSAVELWSPSGSGVRIELRAMRYDSVCSLVLGVLPGAVDPATMARIATTSGGLPGLVVALAETGRKNGRLAKRDGVWSAGSDLWSAELSQAVAPILAGLDEVEIEALRTVALTSAMSVDDAVSVLPWELLDGLEESGLLHVMSPGGVLGDQGSMIGIYPPLVADYFRHETRTIRRHHVAESVASVVRADAAGAPLLVLPPPTFDPDVGTESETVRSQFLKGHGAAEVAARRTAWMHDPRPRTAMPYILSLHNHGADAALITEVVEKTPQRPAEEPDTAILQIWRACYTAIAGNDLGSALQLLRRVGAEQPSVDSLMRATEGHLQLMLDRQPDDDLMRPSAPSELALSQEARTVLLAESLVAKGQCAAASGQLAGARIEFSPYRLRADVTEELSLVLRGEIDRGLAASTEKLRAARVSLDAAAIAGHSYVVALGLLLAGRLDDLEHHLDATLGLVETPMMQWHFQVGSLVFAALLAAARGRRSYAKSLAMQARTHGQRPGPFPGMVPDNVLEPLSTTDADDKHGLWPSVRDRLERGYIAQAILHSIWAAERTPDLGAARQIQEAAAETDSRPLQLVADYGVAIAEGDSGALTRIGDELFECGFSAVAVRAQVAAIRLRRGNGDAVGAARAADSLWTRSRAHGTDLGMVSTALARDVDLTPRELEIARLVSSGRTNQSIAGELSLSVRTVENHLLSAYRKIGVERREGLIRTMSGWLSSA